MSKLLLLPPVWVFACYVCWHSCTTKHIFADSRISHQPVNGGRLCTNKMERHYNPGLHGKGKCGERKKYYKGTRKVARKRKPQCDQNVTVGSVGDTVVYQYDEKIFRGCVKSVLGANTWLIGPNTASDAETVITTNESPVLLSKLQITSFSVLQDVLVVWDEINLYTNLICGTVFRVEHDHAWVIVPQQYSKHALKCYLDDICSNPYTSSDVHQSPICVEKHFSIYDVNIIDVVLSATKQELSELKACYKDACQQILECENKTELLTDDYDSLAASYALTLEKVEALERAMDGSYSQHVSDTCRIKTLQGIVGSQNQSLRQCQSTLSTKRNDIDQLRTLYQSQKEILDETRQILAVTKHKLNMELVKNKKITSTNEKLVSENCQLSKELLIEQMKRKCAKNLEVMAGNSRNVAEGCVVLAREAGSQQRPSALVPVPLPRTASKDASTKTLENRARVLSKVINMLSSIDKVSEEDAIATLSAYFRQNPSLLTQICDKVDMKIIKEITPAEAVDLKVLLRLPMNRVRELRTFLNNLGIRIFPSESLVYSELIARKKSYDSGIEVGTVQLKKTVSAEAPTDVTFVKMKSLTSHIEKAVSRAACDGSFTTDGFFADTVWLKIGGDKGGSTTKLAMQVANISNSNSPDNTELIGMFEATDSHDNMMAIFRSFTQDFIDIQKQLSLSIGDCSKNCEVFLFGDYEFLCKVLGHMGASASYPCLWCHVKLSALANNQGTHSPMLKDSQQQAYVINPDWPTKRTAEDFVNDLANNKVDRRRNGDRRLNGANHHSIAYDPILPIVTDMDHVIPPSLHILLGLVVRYFKYLETLCRTLDHGTIGERDVALNEQWENASVAAREAELAHLHAEEDLRAEEQLLQDFRSSLNGEGEGGAVVKCAMPVCALAGRDVPQGDVEWIQCVQCGRDYNSGWFHVDCLGLGRVGADDFSVCPVCDESVTTEDDVMRMQKERIVSAKERVSARKTVSRTSKSTLDTIYTQVQKTHGPKEAELIRILENELKVQKQAYHSQCFVGNHCKKIVDNHHLLLRVLEPSVQRDKLSGLFERLRGIFSFFSSRFLENSEVIDLCEQCWELGEWFPVAFPEERIPPKLHMLIAHIPQCAQRWRTVGLLSEQGLESIHASLNKEERVYASVREKQQRMKLVFNQHLQRVVADKSGLNVKRRKCIVSGCGGRLKLQDGIRKCQSCGDAE